MQTRRLLFIAAGLLGLVVTTSARPLPKPRALRSAETWQKFGKTALAAAPADIQNGSDLEKARYVASQASIQMETDGVKPNYGAYTRLRGVWERGYYNGGTGNCGDCTTVMRNALSGAGLATEDNSFPVECAGRTLTQAIGLIPDPVNHNHGTFAVILTDASGRQRTVVFDNWSAASEAAAGGTDSSYADFGVDDKYNGMDIDEWGGRMETHNYTCFAYNEQPNYYPTVAAVLEARKKDIAREQRELDEQIDFLVKLWEERPEEFKKRVELMRRQVGINPENTQVLAEVKTRIAQRGQEIADAEAEREADLKQAAWEDAKGGTYPGITYEEFEKYYDPKTHTFAPPDTFTALDRATILELRDDLKKDFTQLEIDQAAIKFRAAEAVLDELHGLMGDDAAVRARIDKEVPGLQDRLRTLGLPTELTMENRGQVGTWRKGADGLPELFGPTISCTTEMDIATNQSSDDYVAGMYFCEGYGGVSKSWFPNGTVREVFYFDAHGDRHGPYLRQFSDGKPKETGAYVHGEPHGEYTSYQEVGAQRWHYRFHTDTYNVGVPDGPFLTWHGDGRLTDYGQFVGAKKEGEWLFVNDETWERDLVYYHDGKKHGMATHFSRNGAMTETVEYQDGKCNGFTVEYDSKGRVTERTPYTDGRKNGTATFNRYGRDGSVTTWTTTFADGNSVSSTKPVVKGGK